jgi:hypothetical protein
VNPDAREVLSQRYGNRPVSEADRGLAQKRLVLSARDRGRFLQDAAVRQTHTRGIMTPLIVDMGQDPDVQLRIDSYSVPAEAQAEFEVAIQGSVAILETLPGFRGHLAFKKASGGSCLQHRHDCGLARPRGDRERNQRGAGAL